MEQKILSALFHNREAYDKLHPFLIKEDFSETGSTIYGQIREFYDADDAAKNIDKEILYSYFDRKYPKHSDGFKRIVEGLKPVSIPNLLKEFLEFKREQSGMRLGQALISQDNGRIDGELDEYLKYKDGAEDLFEVENDIFVGTSLAELVDTVRPDKLIRLAPKSLNQIVDGGVPPETHICIFAQTEVGKSLFAINMCASFLKQGLKVLYLENEDPRVMTQLRFYSRLSGMNKHDILKDTDKAERLAKEKGFDNLILVSRQGSIPELRTLVKEHEPDVLVINQLQNLHARGQEGVQKLGYLATEIRNLVKKHKLVGVSITQAADSARNKLVLDDGDIYFSNVAIQAQIDLLLGIGVNPELRAQNRRMVTPIKNKISGSHEPFPVFIDPYLSKVISV